MKAANKAPAVRVSNEPKTFLTLARDNPAHDTNAQTTLIHDIHVAESNRGAPGMILVWSLIFLGFWAACFLIWLV